MAQTSSSTLTGTIYDNSGAVVAGAVVVVTNNATGVAQKQFANSAGLVRLSVDRGWNDVGGNVRL